MFNSAKLKLDWARQQIDNANVVWNKFLENDFCSISIEQQMVGNELGDVLMIDGKRQPPPALGLAIGDAIHNLRCALDHAIWEMLSGKNNDASFPMHETRENLADSFITATVAVGQKTKKPGRNAYLERAFPGVNDLFVNQIKPYLGGNTPLWLIGKIDNIDKHRSIIPTIGGAFVGGINAINDDENRVVDGSASVQLGTKFGYAVFRAGSNVRLIGHNVPTADIFFGDPHVAREMSVIPTLRDMLQAAANTIHTLAEFWACNGSQNASNQSPLG
jgi:hypothetical protein